VYCEIDRLALTVDGRSILGGGAEKRTQLDDESDCAHDAEADANSLAQLEELLLVG
jgi:hypothetical protein